MTIDLALAALHGVLFLCFGALLVAALRTVKRMEFYLAPAGARRVRFAFASGSPFPLDLLPEALRNRVAQGRALFVFADKDCGLCDVIVRSLGVLAADYRDHLFVLVSDEAWEPPRLPAKPLFRTLWASPLARRLEVSQQPYALRTQAGAIVDFGIVNSTEQMESLLG